MTSDRLALIGQLNAVLLLGEMKWLHRRRETVTLLDEVTLHRQVSVDYTLPARFADADWPPDWPRFARDHAGKGALEGVPFLLLPKLPANLSNLDLENESGRSLPVMTRQDDALISAHTLEAMARSRTETLPEGIVNQLHDIALAKSDQVHVHVERFANPLPEDDYPGVREALYSEQQIGWWIRTLAQNSIVMAFLPSDVDRRRILKMSYDEPFTPINRWRMLLVQFGLASWDLWIQNPFIAAANYHLEYRCPQGMRARRAVLLDVQKNEVIAEPQTFARRVHLYARDANASRDGLAWISLRPNWQGLLGTSFLVSVWIATSVVTLWLSPGKIADAPAGVPALLLLIPGIVGSVVGRPDSHALTTRVLAWVRRMLLLSAFAAYIAALIVVLSPKVTDKASRGDAVDYLKDALRWPSLVAGLCFATMLVALVMSHPFTHRTWSTARQQARGWIARIWRVFTESSYEVKALVHMTPDQALARVKEDVPVGPGDLEAEGVLLVARRRKLGPIRLWWRSFFARAAPASEGAQLVCGVRYEAPFFTRWIVPFALWHERRRLSGRLQRLADEWPGIDAGYASGGPAS